ncbi:DinB family protein [Aquiflexum sp.]|uniref:DinB family protein n=1 Tax=Aquiflexum sp. TaxID=1872584 RepID=UPI00359390B4
MNEILIPQEGEYGHFYEGYISWVKGKDIPKLLLSQIEEIRGLYEKMGEEKSNISYAPGKWTAKEVLGHITDTDRIMCFRALCFARGEKAALPGFDQDKYVASAHFNDMPLIRLLEDFEMSRYVITSLLKSLPVDSLKKTGVANENDVSVRALFNIIPGHTQHHLYILKERYL